MDRSSLLEVHMKILALIGSPRKGGNTDILVDRILDGSAAGGKTKETIETEKLYLYDYEILPCLDCRKCKKGDHTCSLKDDMAGIHQKMESSDLIIFGTPVYWYGPTAKMKLLMDRMRPFISSSSLKGKKGVLVSPSEEGPGCCGPLVDIFRMSLSYIGMEPAGMILARAYEKGEILKYQDELKRAYDLGSSL